MRRLILVVVWAALSLSAPARAGDAANLAGQAEAEATKGAHSAAIETMRRALLSIWDKAPIAVRRAVFTARKASGFGIYDARPSNVFKQDETLLVYVEPVGYGWSPADGIFRSEITADFELKSPQGQVLAGQKAFGRFNLASRVQNTEYFINLTYGFTGLPPGKFVVATTLHDKIQGKSASFDLPFEVVATQ